MKSVFGLVFVLFLMNSISLAHEPTNCSFRKMGQEVELLAGGMAGTVIGRWHTRKDSVGLANTLKAAVKEGVCELTQADCSIKDHHNNGSYYLMVNGHQVEFNELATQLEELRRLDICK